MTCHPHPFWMMCHLHPFWMMCHLYPFWMMCHPHPFRMMCHLHPFWMMCHLYPFWMMCHPHPFRMMCHPHPFQMMCHLHCKGTGLTSLKSQKQLTGHQTISLIYLTFWLISLVPLTADDMQMTPGVVLYEIGQLRQVSRWRFGWHMSSTSQILPKVSLSCHPHIICMSSTGHLHIVCARFQQEIYFHLKSRQLC